ncbi:MAG: septum site-determining protein MinC [Lachnospiraceae bacterium]|nr:septum site-determining protein MinC [Lachnospiraceae bacterium]
MKGIISLKGNKYGLSVNISKDASFEEIKTNTAEYFKSASKMFGKEKIAIGFEGRVLSDAERDELVEVIRENCTLDILCVMDFNSGTEERFRKVVQKYDIPDFIHESLERIKNEETLQPEAPITEPEPEGTEEENKISLFSENGDISKVARFFKGNVRSGMVINEESSLVILGDINPGGEIYSAGNIIILGSLKGKAFAGINGNQNAFVFALNMDPIQIRIADKIGRASDSKKKSSNNDEHEPKIALVKDNAIAIELVSRTVLNDIIL